MTVKIQVVFYSVWGHIYRMAQEVAAGAREVAGAEVELLRVPELIPPDVLEKIGAVQAQKAFAGVPAATPAHLADADAILFGVPTRFGNMAGSMRMFLDQTGGLWAKGALAGKIGSVFTSTATQHGGQETTITSTHSTLLHHGMLIAGVPYTVPELTQMDEIMGGSPYGAGTLSGGDGKRQPSEIELRVARGQGRRVADLAKKLKAGSS
jgi:NAD(P)H dehydrogenase (quinone)